MDGLRERVLQLAKEKGLTQRDMEEAAGVAHSTYDGMWERGTVTLARLEGMAQRLGIDVLTLLGASTVRDPIVRVAEPAASYGTPRPRYIEERVEWLEAEVRKLKEQQRAR
jgi:transcriptional regulator with XRE-family HTH domain